MGIRTDLAIELGNNQRDTNGINIQTKINNQLTVTHIKVLNQQGSAALGKPIGNYINIDVPDLTMHGGEYLLLEKTILDELKTLSFAENDFLVAGLGNRNITADTLGPATADSILATRHLSAELRKQTGLEKLKNVSVIMPGVLGQTGIETLEIIKGIIKSAHIKALLVIDAFAASDLSRLGTTIQLTDAGISPGSGVGNNRSEISKNTLGIPVIALGVPTCVDATTLALSFTSGPLKKNAESMIVTPKEIDMLIDRAAAVISRAVNCFLQPDTERDLLLSIV